MLRKTEGRRGRQRMRWLDEHEQTLGESKGQGSLASCSPWGRRESDVTLRLNKKLLEDRNCVKQEDIFLTPSINVPSQPTPPTLIFLLYSHQLCSVQFSRSVVLCPWDSPGKNFAICKIECIILIESQSLKKLTHIQVSHIISKY